MKSKAAAHINYIQYRREDRAETGREGRVKAERREREGEQDSERRGELGQKFDRSQEKQSAGEAVQVRSLQERDDVEPDKKPGARQMYSHNNDYYSGAQLKKDIAGLGRNDVVHKLIISPGRNDVDTKSYVREVMTELGRAKGQDLRYGFVVHENTDHKHAHVVLLGRDENAGQVRIDKNDHMRIRAFGDRYLEREHNIERVLDRDMEEFCRTRNLNPMFEKERGEEFYERLYKSDKAIREHLEWEKFNTDWKRFIEDKEGFENRPHLGKSEYHELGRISDLTALMNNDLQKEIWTDIADSHPEMMELADEKLAQLASDRVELQSEIDLKTQANDPFRALDSIADQINQEQKQFQDLMKDGIEPENSPDRVDEHSEIEIDGRTYTRFDSLKDLMKADDFCREDYSHRIPKDEYSQLWTWIGTKEKYGDNCFGEPPKQEKEIEQVQDERSLELPLAEKNLDEVFDKQSEGTELKPLDDFVGFSIDKQLDLDRHQESALLEPVPEISKELTHNSLDDFLGFEREGGSEIQQELASDRGLMFETPLDNDKLDRDDSDDLFEQGFV